MQTMPHPKNIVNAKLREKQREAVEKIRANPSGKYLFVLPGGYGKTKAAIAAYVAAREKGVVNRLLIVTPSREQRDSWLDCKPDFDWLSVDVKTITEPIPGGGEIEFCSTDISYVSAANERHRMNTCEVFVVNIQALTSPGKAGVAKTLMAKGRWMVVAEECHHYAVEKSWGRAISDLDSEILIGLSATPFRSEGDHLFSCIMDSPDRLVHCTIEQAIAEGAIRPMVVQEGAYQVEFQEGGGTRHAFKLSELERYLYENNLELSEFEARKELRVLDQFVRPLFLEALDTLEHLNDRHPGQHQMIVHAPSVLLAKTYCKWFNLLCDTSHGVAAKWVGSGAEQSDSENAEIIREFKGNKFLILVQVQMFGEGSDNPRASVGLWLSLIGSHNPSCHQGMVRHSRRNYAVPVEEDIAYMFIPEDSPGLERALEIAAKSEYSIAVREMKEEGESEIQLKIPTLEEMERQIRATAADLIGIGSGEDYSRKVQEVKDSLKDDKHDIAERLSTTTGWSAEALAKMFEATIEKRAEEIVLASIKKEQQRLTEEQVLEGWRSRVEICVKRIARYLAEKHHPVAIETSTFSTLVGTLKKKINTLLKQSSDGKSRSSKNKENGLTVSELKKQFDYLSKLAKRIEAGDIPTELML